MQAGSGWLDSSPDGFRRHVLIRPSIALSIRAGASQCSDPQSERGPLVTVYQVS